MANWQRRYAEEVVDGLLRDETRPPGTAPTFQGKANEVVAMTLKTPSGGNTHRTGRAMAKASGLSLRTIQRIWANYKLRPHRVRTFKRSTDPNFAEPKSTMSSASTWIRRATRSCSPSTRRAMCGRPLRCKRKVILRDRLQPCVRPIDAVLMTAGLDEVRDRSP
jgi:hypothetical protein